MIPSAGPWDRADPCPQLRGAAEGREGRGRNGKAEGTASRSDQGFRWEFWGLAGRVTRGFRQFRGMVRRQRGGPAAGQAPRERPPPASEREFPSGSARRRWSRNVSDGSHAGLSGAAAGRATAAALEKRRRRRGGSGGDGRRRTARAAEIPDQTGRAVGLDHHQGEARRAAVPAIASPGGRRAARLLPVRVQRAENRGPAPVGPVGFVIVDVIKRMQGHERRLATFFVESQN